MTRNLAIPFALHQLGAIVWIGGMFFAHFALRPTIKQTLEPPARIQVALGVFGRFFPWVWASVTALWVSGTWILVVRYRFEVAPQVSIMIAIALAMTLIFAGLFFLPYRKMRSAVDQENWRWASAKFALIRKLLALNLVLGILTVLVAATGPDVIPAIKGALGGM